MSVDLFPRIIDYPRFVEEIDRLRLTVPPEELAESVRNLLSELDEKNNGIVIVSKTFGRYLNDRYILELDDILHQLLLNAWRKKSYGTELMQAQVLYHFIGPFCVHQVVGHALNEFGFDNATILDHIGVRQLAVLYSHIDLPALQPVFTAHCQNRPSGNPYDCFYFFEEFTRIVEKFGALVKETVEMNKGLYLFIE